MNKVTIYGRMSCGFCTRARRLCEVRGLPHEWVDMEEKGLTKEDLSKLTGSPVRTVPQIFVDGEHVGGFDEFANYVETHLDAQTG
ncbi:glutaredoxin 1 [Halospina denitrificans]|uniref:Glutaredoxin 1 n=1 Tax=Halospina denitrificans TaxID=332522 RepID=A0A4R7JK74_9GAMM|nr:GrxA family glutaredoxin [Halospina denitrificans]TDT37836.1 glutaredoxin 1 [Halospina denitrificans]